MAVGPFYRLTFAPKTDRDTGIIILCSPIDLNILQDLDTSRFTSALSFMPAD